MSTVPPATAHFATLAPAYDVLLCDVWGVVHNGVAPFPHACDALMRFRAQGGSVILITNSPRPSDSVARQCDRLAVPREVYDGIVSSGDMTRSVIVSRAGQSLFHLGPERDSSIFTGLGVRFAPLESADYVVCSGLFNDETETPEDYRDRLQAMHGRGQFMLCANPDVVVMRGDKLVYCAGALADLYAGLGGEAFYAGKPYRPIYDMAIAKAEAVGGGKVTLARMLAIGDSLRTDLRGAATLGIDFLFVTSGIHSEQFEGNADPQAQTVRETLGKAAPKAIMQDLTW
ncbi:MAG: TIGR01459 family HAD-type hydrolase [Pseudolabrys sp.]